MTARGRPNNNKNMTLDRRLTEAFLEANSPLPFVAPGPTSPTAQLPNSAAAGLRASLKKQVDLTCHQPPDRCPPPSLADRRTSHMHQESNREQSISHQWESGQKDHSQPSPEARPPLSAVLGRFSRDSRLDDGQV